MKIYNTLYNKKEEFVPLQPNKVRMYICGPTVYNYIHIGNARPCVVFDAVRRFLEYKGFKVNYVQNFTDVDDRIIKRANDELSDMLTVSNKYIEEFFTDVDGLNVKRATSYPRVTGEMPEIITMVATLIEKGFAYEVNGSVYYSPEAFEGYGKLSNRKFEDMETGTRVAANDEKTAPMDFVLWKPAKENEPFWQSPWGNGRPGWHIECSAMSKKYLGEQIDIHAGGEDLIFPHHENEIAQSEAANGVPFAKYWLHNAMINIDNQKMSKSRGNFFTVRDIVKKYSYDVLRFFILMGQYRMPLNFSDELLSSAKTSLDRIKNCYRELKFSLSQSEIENLTDEESVLVEKAKQFEINFVNSMEDDFNTANAITDIFELVKFINIKSHDLMSKQYLLSMIKQLETLTDILGIIIKDKTKTIDETYIEEMLLKRKAARANKDFKLSDEIRDELIEKGVTIKDTREGVSWFYSGE